MRSTDEKKKPVKIRNLKSKNAKIQHLSACNGNFNVLDADSIKFSEAEINTLDVQNLTLGGRNVNCLLTQPAVETDIATFVPLETPPPRNVNQTVYEALIQNALTNQQELQNRIFIGRNDIKEYLNTVGCPPSCPPLPDEPVPLQVYGALTQPIFREFACDTNNPEAGKNKQLTTAVNFNLQVDYHPQEAQSVDNRVVSVLVQLGYINPESPPNDPEVIIDEIFIANRQFTPTLDVEYGENFANVINIPSQILLRAVFAMPDANNTGAVQMVVYKEQGLCIWKAVGDGFECRQDETNNLNSQALYQTQTSFPCPTGQKEYVDKYQTKCIPCSDPCQGPDAVCGECNEEE